MNKNAVSFVSSVFCLLSVAITSAHADSRESVPQVGILASKSAEVSHLTDQQLQKAIKLLIEKQVKQQEKRIPNNKPDFPLGQRLPKSDKVFILGGAEAFPM